jgi:Lon protease-like protein
MSAVVKKDLIDGLPRVLPLLPLRGAVLMPRTQLPVPLVADEYISLLSDCVKDDLLLGVVQPITYNDKLADNDASFFSAGSLAKVIEVEELEEKTLVVTLGGICRFDILQELPKKNGYRIAEVDYSRYQGDLVQEADFIFDRQRLLKALERYFLKLELEPNWNEIVLTSNEKLITSLVMACPFAPNEKQALLESPTLKTQSEIITTLIEFANFDHYNTETTH